MKQHLKRHWVDWLVGATIILTLTSAIARTEWMLAFWIAGTLVLFANCLLLERELRDANKHLGATITRAANAEAAVARMARRVLR